MLHKEIFSFIDKTVDNEYFLKTEKGQEYLHSLSEKLFVYESGKISSKWNDFSKFCEKVQLALEDMPVYHINCHTVGKLQSMFTDSNKIYDSNVLPELVNEFSNFTDIANNLKLIAGAIDEDYSHTTLAILTNIYLVGLGFSLIPFNFYTLPRCSLKVFYSNASVEFIRNFLLAESFHYIGSNAESKFNIKGTISKIPGIVEPNKSYSKGLKTKPAPLNKLNRLTFD